MYEINSHSIVLIISLLIIILIMNHMTNIPNIKYTKELYLTDAGNNDTDPSFWPEMFAETMSDLTTGIIPTIFLKFFHRCYCSGILTILSCCFCGFRIIGPIFASYWIYLVRRTFTSFKISTTV